MKYLVLIIGLFFLSFSAQAQNTVKGSVVDENNQLIPGVSVLEKNTSNGVQTDFDGNFSIKVDENAILVFSYLGFKSQEIIVGDQKTIKVKLTQDVAQLDEIVVIGYGAVGRDKIATSIATVTGEEINKVVASNPAEALQGRAAGVQVLSNGGAPGAAPRIVIRGITSPNGTQPLIVLDGVMLPASTSINFINPQDIQTMQILKDAAASAIYGSRASNGVVLITTKRGKEGKPTISLDATFGMQNIQKFKSAGAQEYINVMNARRINDGNTPDPNLAGFTGEGTDWWNEVVEDLAPVTNVNLRASGGSENIKYSASVGVFDQRSNLQIGFFQKINTRFNVDFKISDKLQLKQDVSVRLQNSENTPNILFNTLRVDPVTPVFVNQSERIGRNEFSIYGFSRNLVPNPVGQLARTFNEDNFNEFFTNTQLNYKINSDLTFSSQLGLTFSGWRRKNFNPEFELGPTQLRDINSVNDRIDQNFDYVFNNTLTFEKTIKDKHYVNFLAGALVDSQSTNFIRGEREGIPSNTNVDLRQLNGAEGEAQFVTGNQGTDNILSGVFRGIYSFDNKYIVNGSVRVDQSSRFPKDSRTGVFSSASFSWDVDSEDFFESEYINNLRFKVGFGEVGNQDISRDGQFFSVGSGDFVFGQERVIANFLGRFGNPNLRWETVRDQNFGVEMGFLNNTITFSAEYYKRTSKDLLFNVESPNFTGIPGLVAQNVGSFDSSGFDLQLGYNNQWGDFSLGLNLTASTNESRASELAPGNEQILGGRSAVLGNRFLKITELGRTVGLFYGFKTDGIFQNQTELNSHTSEDGTIIQPNAQPGDLRYVDTDGNGTINDDDLQVIGNPFADIIGGLTVNMEYKKFDLSMQLYGTAGNDVFNFNRQYINSGTQNLNVVAGALDRVWSPTNTGAEFPRLSEVDLNGNYQRPSDLFVEDGSYLRLRNLQIGYNFDFKGIKKFRLYVSGQNLLTFTKYTGFDPEVASGNNVINNFGLDFSRNPVARTFLLGLNLTL
ncbi:TonB-dependent receptor [uncultured Polaribacter sp.]|uniref:SusC/RagA family TonB-linked outer membrane protein n=1 Tax=uncultured Polaribacter sp. TaxID=174711 RepID=UPI00262D7AA1|nr:TonB-dependent receptor [uncultured Polaribacter sp.]